MKNLRTPAEEGIGRDIAAAFQQSRDGLEERLETFPRYARRKTITRFITLYELFKLVLPVKGSIVECGVLRGFGLMTWAHLSAVMEPSNLTRRIYGFDTFTGFPSVSEGDANPRQTAEPGQLSADCHDELKRLIEIYDADRFLGHIDKIHLIRGDSAQTIPVFIEANAHLVVSLLFLDFDLYEPTRIALSTFVRRMPKGSILAFDQLDNPIWPGETRAVLDTIGVRDFEIRRFPWDPYVGYVIL